MTPSVSVAIKSYNHAAYVHESIASVFAQSFQDFEIVVTDDGSTDVTPDVIARFDDPRIRFERFERNHGISVAMNATTARARGEFVAILNSDDVALPGRLQTQVDFLRAHPEVAAVFGRPRLIGERSEPAAGYDDVFAIPFADGRAPRHAWLRHFFFHGNCLCAPTAMIRRSALETGRYDPRLTNLQDLDRWIQLLEHHEIHVLADELTAFRIRAGNRNMSAPRRDSVLRGAFEMFEILKRYRRFAPAFLREIFAADIVRNAVDTSRPTGVWLAEIALTVPSAVHPLFALDLLFEAATGPQDLARLRELSGTVNAFNRPEPPA
ncbi:MAG: glycosyltransferase [Candidatus Eremiobacteraeota bacterium]|nr:glycosyltransferase [Candidatus Eremiobacteraeota bacterium]